MLRRKPTRLTLNDADQEEFQTLADDIAQQVSWMGSCRSRKPNFFEVVVAGLGEGAVT